MPIGRGPQRRAEDFEADVGRWATVLVVHRGKVWAFGLAVASIVTWVATTAGYRYVAPRDDFKRLSAVVDTVRADIVSLRAANTARDVERALVREQLEFLTYLACGRVPVADAYAREKCTRIRATP